MMTWDCFRYCIKMEYQKITNLLNTTLDEVPRFITKKWVEVGDQPGSTDDRYSWTIGKNNARIYKRNRKSSVISINVWIK